VILVSPPPLSPLTQLDLLPLQYIGVGLFGYLQFGADVASNILSSYPKNDLVLVMIACFLFAVIVTYPLINFAVRLSVDYILFSKSYHDKTLNKNHQNYRMYGYSIVLFLISASVGAFVDDVGPVFSLVGSTSTVLLSLVLPTAIYLRLKSKGFMPAESSRSVDLFLTILSWAVLIVGVIVGVAGFTFEILDIAGVTF